MWTRYWDVETGRFCWMRFSHLYTFAFGSFPIHEVTWTDPAED